MPCKPNNASICAAIVILLLVVILIPLSFSYLEYYEYGLIQRKATGSVDITTVYNSGRYPIGPGRRFIKYQADSHYVHFDRLSVFSKSGTNESIGLEFLVDIGLTYFLIQDEIGLLHKDLSRNYDTIIESRAKDAIKNEAIGVSFNEYFQDRKSVERRFKEAISHRWAEPPSLHCSLDQFHLGRIRIPDSVASKQLEARVQNERNDKESFIQQAQIERELTAVEVNTIDLEREKVLRTARAEASLIRSRARSQSERIQAQAQTNGTNMLLAASDIVTQEQKSAFTYIRTLRNRNDLNVDVSYLSADNVLRTTPASSA
ncbi:SPFH domain / Band 7 family protein [Nitzschia inconspicua]|uniref:SPFH domain / Band 7 family protein n=1 Tax=Nitzschia inconspicua TaxID=303405 RepID=A0A9K3M2H4_9STRA|nr:SPFH domain / Band 7 family protein [Nitzschia inconspicua]